MERVIVLVGQTAVGKTSISIKLAKELNAEIINGDAMQVYKEFNVLTAKISNDEMGNVPHHLFNIKSVYENYNVEEYQRNIRSKITEINSRGKIPLIVGGTGLYIKSALFDYTFNEEKVTHDKIEKKYEHLSNEELFNYLKKLDEKATYNLHMNNRRRVLRAIEIFETTGKSKSSTIEEQEHKMIYDATIIGMDLPRDILYLRIDERVDIMFKNGIIDEVRNYDIDTTASKAIGYPEIKKYLNNEISLEECKNLIKVHTHQFAKRQMTWLKHQFDVTFVQNDDTALDNILNIINKKSA